MPPSPARVSGPVLSVVASALLVLAGALGTPTALAATPASAPAPTAAAASSGEHQARELFQRAEKSFNLGRFDEALIDYQAAYQAKELPAFLFNIAQCYRNLHDYERARFFYRRYLALDPRSSNRRLVEDLIAEMTRAIDKGEGGPALAPAQTTTGGATATANLAPAPTPSTPVLLAQDGATVPATAHPTYKRWWFWTGVGALVTGAVVAGILVSRPGTQQGSLGTINAR
jgi:tetratricopeptide (TPR) repeat protein